MASTTFDIRLRGATQDERVGLWGTQLTASVGIVPLIQIACGCKPSGWDGKRADKIKDSIYLGSKVLLADPEEYRGLEPLLHKQTVEDAADFLLRLYKLLCQHPNARVEVWYE